MKIRNKKLILILIGGAFALFTLFLFTNVSLAGNIDSVNKYAWGENVGWINFGSTQGDVEVTDSELTGYAWGENVGWISLNCSNTSSCSSVDYKVANDGNGSLSGYAWGENVGWINFNPTYGGVNIGSAGTFTGYAWGENTGWIVFHCATTNSCSTVDYGLKTDWLPQTVRPQCDNGLDDDGDGLIDYPDDPGCSSLDEDNELEGRGTGVLGGGGGAPTFPYKITINNNDYYTNSRTVILTFEAEDDIERMAISNSLDFSNIGQENFSAVKEWDLCAGEDECLIGEYTIYVKFYDQYGHVSSTYADTIILDYEYAPEELEPKEEAVEEAEEEKVVVPVSPPEAVEPTAPPFVPEEPSKIIKILEKLPEFLSRLVPEIFKPKKITPTEIPLEKLVPIKTPLAMNGTWELFPSQPIQAFVFVPLPKSIQRLTQKFPELGETFEQVGISKITDIGKLKRAKLVLPGLTETMGLPAGRVKPGKTYLPGGMPLVQLSSQIKQRMPTEIIFAKTGGELIDFNIALSISEKGDPEQRIFTVAGRTLNLMVKPDAPARSVNGYLVLKSRELSSTFFETSVNSLVSSLIFAKPAFAKPQEQPVKVEEKLVLMEFEYADTDGDGIWTAEIQAPAVDGEYEVITVIDYFDPDLGRRQIRLITVVDPEGYIYEKYGDKEIRVPGAIISIYWLNSETKQYELWPAKEYQQENPQVTDVTGKYSFLVPEGFYYLTVDASGYLPYEGKPFQVKEGRGVHFNIEIKTKYWWLDILDWKTVALIIVVLFLLYNFYRDRKRDRYLKHKT